MGSNTNWGLLRQLLTKDLGHPGWHPAPNRGQARSSPAGRVELRVATAAEACSGPSHASALRACPAAPVGE
jgi:hypothetical protein